MREILRHRDFFKDFFSNDPKKREAFFAVVESLFEVIILPNAIKDMAEHIANGAWPVIFGNHQSHIDAVWIKKIAKMVKEEANILILTGRYRRKNILPGCYLPVAASVDTGHQSPLLKVLYGPMEKWLKENDVYPVLLVRRKDERLYGLHQASTTRSLREVRDGIETDWMLAILPEGSVEGGRLDDSGQPYGIILPEGPTLYSHHVLRARELGKEVVALPVGVSGSPEILDPYGLLPTEAVYDAFEHNKEFPGDPYRLAKVVVGCPFLSGKLEVPEFDELRAPASVHLEIYLQSLEIVSRLIPEEERGIFRNK